MSEQQAGVVSVIIPAYNEEQAIGADLDLIVETMDASGYEYEIIVVDDGSTDRTAEIAESKGVRVIRHPINRGSGASRRTGILQAKGDIIVMTDGDGTYPNQDIPRLLEHIPAFDQVVGARTSEQGSWPLLRAPTKWFIRQLASYLTGMHIPDLNSGLRAFKRDVMLKYLYLLPDGFSCVTTMTLAFLCNGYTVKYVPIEYYQRVGRSKFHPIRDTYNYLVTVITIVAYFNPLKFFIPTTLFLMTVGVARFLYHAIWLRNVRESDVMIILAAIIVGSVGVLADLIVKEQKYRLMNLSVDK